MYFKINNFDVKELFKVTVTSKSYKTKYLYFYIYFIFIYYLTICDIE